MNNLRELFSGLNTTPEKKYPFEEGDDYWTIEKNEVVWSCWDDVSEEIHDEDPTREYFKSHMEAEIKLKQIGNE